jgi:T5orf172 domain
MSTDQPTGTGSGCQAVGVLQASHVYILWHSSANLLKIGKANSILDRAKAFGLDSIDLGRSVALRLKSVEEAVHVEKTLHKTFKKWSVSKDDAIASGIGSDGATEWFSGDCWNRLIAYLDANSDLLEFTVLPSTSLLTLLEAREARRLELDRLRVELKDQQLTRRLASDIQRQARDVRIAARNAELERQFVRIAGLLEQRMIAIDNSEDAVFLGCTSPYEGRFELLFLSRPSFTTEGRDVVWVDMSETDVYADGCFQRIVTSWSRREDEDCALEQVNVMFPTKRSRGDGLDWPQFAGFIELLLSAPTEF